jgi:hypothetical protein
MHALGAVVMLGLGPAGTSLLAGRGDARKWEGVIVTW